MESNSDLFALIIRAENAVKCSYCCARRWTAVGSDRWRYEWRRWRGRLGTTIVGASAAVVVIGAAAVVVIAGSRARRRRRAGVRIVVVTSLGTGSLHCCSYFTFIFFNYMRFL